MFYNNLQRAFFRFCFFTFTLINFHVMRRHNNQEWLSKRDRLCSFSDVNYLAPYDGSANYSVCECSRKGSWKMWAVFACVNEYWQKGYIVQRSYPSKGSLVGPLVFRSYSMARGYLMFRGDGDAVFVGISQYRDRLNKFRRIRGERFRRKYRECLSLGMDPLVISCEKIEYFE